MFVDLNFTIQISKITITHKTKQINTKYDYHIQTSSKNENMVIIVTNQYFTD